jgi:hypothetical protein
MMSCAPLTDSQVEVFDRGEGVVDGRWLALEDGFEVGAVVADGPVVIKARRREHRRADAVIVWDFVRQDANDAIACHDQAEAAELCRRSHLRPRRHAAPGFEPTTIINLVRPHGRSGRQPPAFSRWLVSASAGCSPASERRSRTAANGRGARSGDQPRMPSCSAPESSPSTSPMRLRARGVPGAARIAATHSASPASARPTSGADASRDGELLLGTASRRFGLAMGFSVALARAAGSKGRPAKAAVRILLDRVARRAARILCIRGAVAATLDPSMLLLLAGVLRVQVADI